MGVCCIVFDIDGMLFEFCMNFLNIEKNKMLRFFFQYFMFSLRFMLFPTLKKKLVSKKKSGREGGVEFFLEKQFFLISRFMLFSTLKFLQIVERDSWNLYPLCPLFPCSDFLSQIWGWFGGGGVIFFSHFRKQILGIQTNYFSFNVFFVVFLYAGNNEKCPFTYSYWLNGRFLQIVDIGHFIMRLEIFKSAPSLTG